MNRMREARLEADLSIRELSARTRIDPGHLSRIENEYHTPRPETIKRILRGLRLKVSDAATVFPDVEMY